MTHQTADSICASVEADAREKLSRLQARLRELGRVAVAFSAGVDSTFLLKVAADTLGRNAFAVTGRTASFPDAEAEQAAAFCAQNDIRQILISVDQLSIPGFRDNPPERCYLCKRALFSVFLQAAKQEGADALIEGSNADDAGDYRPGRRAIRELGVLSPMEEAGLTKREIRQLSRQMGLPTWDKPAMACLATRLPVGETITGEKLQKIDRAEQVLRGCGFRQVRVRMHGDIARLELDPAEFSDLMDAARLPMIRDALHGIGFRYVALDLDGYRTGSMNQRTIDP